MANLPLTLPELSPPLPPSWYEAPFVIRSEPASLPGASLDALEHLSSSWRAHAEFYPRGARSAAASALRLAPRRSLRRLRQGDASGAYALLPVPPRRWPQLLAAAGVEEPPFVAEARRRPEEECASAVGHANVSARFERELRWRLLIVGGGPGAGMHLHADHPPASAWHVQLRGRKAWTLCPPNQTRGGGCLEATLGPRDQLFFPRGWRHATATLDAGSASASRLLVTPPDAPLFGAAVQDHCTRGLALSRGSYEVLCAALAPCLRRLMAGQWTQDGLDSQRADSARILA